MATRDERPTMVLVGGAGAPGLGVDVAVAAITQARDHGLRVHLINESALLSTTAEAGDLADEVTAVHPEHVEEAVKWAVDHVASGGPVDLVFSVREFSLMSAARIAAELGLPGNPPEVVNRVRTKDVCREWLRAAGFPQPRMTVCADEAQARAALDGPGPWVVKPRDASGSEGVSLLRSLAGLPAAIAALPERDAAFLVEDFVDGTEYSVEGLLLGGEPHVLAVTEKRKLPPPHFVEVGHALPARLPASVTDELSTAAADALRRLEVRFGLFHLELWHTRTGVVLGEVHCRLGGDYIHRLLAYANPGLDMFGRVYDDLLGRPVDPPGPCTRAAVTRYLTPPPGRLVAVEGWDEAVRHPAVIVGELAVRPGDPIPELTNSDERVAALVVGAGTVEEADRIAEELAGSVRFRVEAR